MPRRPRPVHRASPHTAGNKLKPTNSSNKAKTASEARFVHPVLAESEQEEVSVMKYQSSSEEFEEGPSQNASTNRYLETEEDDQDDEADTPRVVRWEDEEEDGYVLENNDFDGEMPLEKVLKSNLQDLPLGVLRRAQRILGQAESEDNSASESEDEDASITTADAQDIEGNEGKRVTKVEWYSKPRKDISKRPNKHAPVEISSKKPVTRRRTVVEVPKIVPRDPRFLPTAGQFSPEKYHKQYTFLTEKHKEELSTLREALKKARKALSSSPKDLRSAREQEVDRLERAVKRGESIVNKDRLDQVEREVMDVARKEEKERRAQGKGAWYLKKGEKQKLIMRARYEALAKEGGQRAVKKAIEKRQKKISQKEKKSRPFGKSEGKRSLEADGRQSNAKRRRVV